MTLAMTPTFDLFPAFATVFPPGHATPPGELRSAPPTEGGYQLIKTRVIVGKGKIIVLGDSSSGPQILFRDYYEWGAFIRSQDPKVDSYVITNSGRTIVFRKDSNCGCGSRLRSYNAYGSLSSDRDPIA